MKASEILRQLADMIDGQQSDDLGQAGGHKIKDNQSIQLLYTCFDNTAGNCYVATTFL